MLSKQNVSVSTCRLHHFSFAQHHLSKRKTLVSRLKVQFIACNISTMLYFTHIKTYNLITVALMISLDTYNFNSITAIIKTNTEKGLKLRCHQNLLLINLYTSQSFSQATVINRKYVHCNMASTMLGHPQNIPD